jgi:[mycofactocin precursor peptide]-tyrosine decarboxylase / 3-amino-5-[(4-hydroxyphenyl)methyl]-4,4-dimethylpyrrolidin-2-one synthase
VEEGGMEQLVFITEKGTARTTLGYIDASSLDMNGRYEDETYRISAPLFPPAYQPTEASLYLTAACNLSCQYCYIGQFLDSSTSRSLPTDGWKSIMNDLFACGVRILKLIGGEALLRRDLAELIYFGGKLGFDGIELATNGTIDVLKANQPALLALKSLSVHHVISVSLDSVTPEYNDRIRGKHAQVVQGIRFLKELGLDVSVASIVTTENYSQIDQMAAFAEELGVFAYQFNDLVPIFPHQRRLVIVDPGLRARIVNAIEALKSSHPKMTIANRFVPAPNINRSLFEKHAANPLVASSSLAGCPAGTREAYVLPDGKLVACPMFIKHAEYHSSRSIAGGNFRSLWEADPAIIRFRSFLTTPKLTGKCSTCRSGPVCKGGCRALAFFLHGSMDEQDPRCLF